MSFPTPQPSRRSVLLLLFAALAGCWALAAPGAGAAVQVFERVNVISMDPEARKKVAKRRTVVVEDGTIVAIGKAGAVEVPAGATVIDGKRKYLLPGLYDMHAHGEDIRHVREKFTPEDLYSLYLANGITGVYDPWGFDDIFRWQRDLERGKVVGPRLYFTSPGVNDDEFATADGVESAIRRWARQGYTTVKTHSPITPEKFERVHETARELGMSVVGHALRPGFPLSATLEQGQLMIAHIEEILSVSVPFDRPDSFRSDLEGPLADLANSRTWVTTTVGTYDIIVKTVGDATFERLFERPEMRYLPPSVREFWRDANIYRREDFRQDPEYWDRLLDVKLYIARELVHRAALDRLLLGTDSGIPLLVPGFGIHDELRLLVEAGLTPWQALLIGTYNPAVFLETLESAGTVEVGKRADLVLVDKNPLRKIQNLRTVRGVMVDGVWLSNEDLEARLDALAARWEG